MALLRILGNLDNLDSSFYFERIETLSMIIQHGTKLQSRLSIESKSMKQCWSPSAFISPGSTLALSKYLQAVNLDLLTDTSIIKTCLIISSNRSKEITLKFSFIKITSLIFIIQNYFIIDIWISKTSQRHIMRSTLVMTFYYFIY